MNYWEKLLDLFKKGKSPIPGMDDKTSLVLMLMKMAHADGHVNHFESMYIHMLSNSLGADKNMIGQWKNKLDQVVLVTPDTREERLDFFWRILTAMKMDMVAHEKEIELCYELGKALKFSKKEVERGVTHMEENLRKVVKLNDFVKVVEG